MGTPATKAIDLQELLAAAQLPALPHSAMKIMELARDPNNGPAEFATPIEVDPGLTGQVLRFVNSSYFGFSNEISNVKLAITMVGVRTIKNFTLWNAVFSLMPNPRCGPFDLKVLWQDSLRRGLFARMLAKMLSTKDGEEAFAAALLQDMAIPLLAKELPADYAQLLEQRDAGRRRLSDLEQERFGWDHAQAAGIMARQWRLPIEFKALLEEHTRATQASEVEETPVQIAVTLSALLPSSTDAVWQERAALEAAFERLSRPGGPSLGDLLRNTDNELEDFGPILKVGSPAKLLSEFHEEAAAVVS